MDDTIAIEERLRAFVLTELRWDGDALDLTGDFPLIDSGAVDSLGVLEIAGFIEEHYDIDVDEQELVFDNFSCLSALARYVARKRPRRHVRDDHEQVPSSS